MTIETATYLHEMSTSYPANADDMGEEDDHIRQLKTVLKNTFPGRAGVEGRAIIKNANFTPAATESGCLFVNIAAVTCTLPAVAGVADGTHYEFKPLTHALVIAPYSGTEYIDQGGSRTIDTGNWAIVAKVDGTRWAILTSAALTASAITTALGATAVQQATNANQLGGAAASAFVKSVGGSGPDGAGNVATGGFSVNYANSAGSANSANYATSAGYANSAGSAPANGGNADTVDGYHYNNLPYAPNTAFTNAAIFNVGSVSEYWRFYRANGSYLQVSSGG